jgi:hydroxymethylbilane synthase
MDLPTGALLGTSSLRRKVQVLAVRPDLSVVPLRGNINTRLQRLDENEFDAIILAAAGLKRLKMENRIGAYFSVEEMVPAAGQGAIGIECRLKDKKILELINFLNNKDTYQAIHAERVLNEQLGGSCQVPVAAHAIVKNNLLFLTGMVGNLKGDIILRTRKSGPVENAREIGLLAADDLINQGARELLQNVLEENQIS